METRVDQPVERIVVVASRCIAQRRGAATHAHALGQKVGQQERPGRLQHRLPDHILHFAHVPRPGILAQQPPGLRSHGAHLLVQIAIGLPEKMIDQQVDVGTPFPHRRQIDRVPVESIEQVFAKQVSGDHVFQIPVRRGDDPHVRRDDLLSAHALELLFLQHAQQLALQQGRHVADLVEKQRAAVALLELAYAPLVRAGERALFVSKQLAFQQRFGDRRTIDRQKRPLRSLAELV